MLEAKSLDIPSSHVKTAKNCVRCRQAFGYFYYAGDFCPQCNYKVCRNCRVNQSENGLFPKNLGERIQWLCVLCHKYKYDNRGFLFYV